MDESSVRLVEKQPVSFLYILCLSEFSHDIDMETATMGTVQIVQELSYWTEMVGKNSNVLLKMQTCNFLCILWILVCFALLFLQVAIEKQLIR